MGCFYCDFGKPAIFELMEKNYVFNKEKVFDILVNEPDRIFLETRDLRAAEISRSV